MGDSRKSAKVCRWVRREAAFVPEELLARKQPMEALEERISTGCESVEEEEGKYVAIRSARRLRQIHELGEIPAKEKAVGADVVVGKASADQIAIEQQTPGLTVDQRDSETTL